MATCCLPVAITAFLLAGFFDQVDRSPHRVAVVQKQVTVRVEPSNSLASAKADGARHREIFERDGFLILRSVFSREDVQACHRYLDDVIWAPDPALRPHLYGEQTKAGVYPHTVLVQDESLRKTEFFTDTASLDKRNSTYRMYGIEREPGPHPFHRLIFDPYILTVVQELLGCPARSVSGIIFERGTQQGLHDDTWYALGGMGTGGMVGVWYALDDVDDENGPLMYVPGSNRGREEENFGSQVVPLGHGLRPFRLGLANATQRDTAYDLAQEKYAGKAVPFHAKKGDIGIWHERLMHGGMAIKNWNRTRLSLVMHYKDFCIPFHNTAVPLPDA